MTYAHIVSVIGTSRVYVESMDPNGNLSYHMSVSISGVTYGIWGSSTH